MDISDTIAPDSEQLDAIELIEGPRTFLIEKVSKGPADQPVQIHLKDFPRPWRPGKSMRRVLVACWGSDAAAYIGRRVTLFCDPNVRFGSETVGGTRISHLSHIDERKKVPLLVSRGKSAVYTVEPLTETATPPAAPKQSPAEALVDLYLAEFKVTKQQLEARVALPFDEWAPETLNMLRALGGEIKNGTKTVEDEFPGGAE